MNPVLRLDKVTKRYGGQAALDEVSLEVPPGVVVALLGENGAGKTTTLKILTGLLKPTAGTASIFGEPIHKVTSRARIDSSIQRTRTVEK